MKIDGGISPDPTDAAKTAKAAEDAGYDGAIVPEITHDPFVALALAADATERLELATGIAVAFARNPMDTAYSANDIQLLSRGRFILGLGSQIAAHITKRFAMPWSHPAPRMREYIVAMHEIWGSWNSGSKLSFRGDYYTHTLMTPFFNPGANPYGRPRVFLAAVGEKMTEVAGEVADGLLVHSFTTERYLKDVTIPAFERGLAKAGRKRDEVQVSYPCFVVTGDDEQEMEAAASGVRMQISFYGSTPAYRPVLELHGWGDLQTELNTLSKQGEWGTMAGLIDDDVLHAFAVVAEPSEVVAKLKERVSGVVDRVSFYLPFRSDPERWNQVMRELKAA
jgi:probable F420-dependent oxidoreductase